MKMENFTGKQSNPVKLLLGLRLALCDLMDIGK